MTTECRQCQHPLIYDRNGGEFFCANDKDCRCSECRRPATEAERKFYGGQ